MAGPKYDNILKTLAMQAPDEFFAWLASILGIAAATVEDSNLPTELVTAARYADIIWLIRAAAEQAILHIELQLEPDKEMGERLFGYQARLIEKYHLPVISLVIWLKKTAHIPTPPAVWSWGGQEINRCLFHSIKLWEQPQEAILTLPNPSLWPIAGLMAKTTGASVVRVGQQIAEAPIGETAKSNLVGDLWFLAGIQLKAEVLQAAFRRHPLIDELWKHSSTAQAFIAEKLAEGRKEGELRMARVVLEGRVGALDEKLMQALEQLDVAALEALASDATLTREQLEARLGLGN